MQEQNASMHWMYLLYPDRGLESSAECKPDEYLVSLSSSFSQHGSATSRLMWQLSSMFACGLHPAKLRWQWTVQHLYILPIERDQAFQPALFVFLFCLFLRLTLTGKSSRVNIFWHSFISRVGAQSENLIAWFRVRKSFSNLGRILHNLADLTTEAVCSLQDWHMRSNSSSSLSKWTMAFICFCLISIVHSPCLVR